MPKAASKTVRDPSILAMFRRRWRFFSRLHPSSLPCQSLSCASFPVHTENMVSHTTFSRPVRLELTRAQSGLDSKGANGYASVVLTPSLASHIRRITASPDAPRLSAYARTRHWDQSPPPNAHLEKVPSPSPGSTPRSTSRSAPTSPIVTTSPGLPARRKAASEGSRKTPSPLVPSSEHSRAESRASSSSEAAMPDMFAPQATNCILLSAISRADMPLAPSAPPRTVALPTPQPSSDAWDENGANPCRSVNSMLQEPPGGGSTPLLAS